MTELRFRSPGISLSLGELLSTLLSTCDRATRRGLIEGAHVRAAGRVVDRGTQICTAGSLIEVEFSEAGMPPGLAGIPDDSALAARWKVLVDEGPFERGTLETEQGQEFDFQLGERRDGLASAAIAASSPVSAFALCHALAEAGMPVVGDLAHGGLGVSGGARCFASPAGEGANGESAAIDQGAWPAVLAWRPPADLSESDPSLDFHVSEETARVLAGGHPWIRPDEASDPATAFRPGACVRVRRRKGECLGWAHIEGGGPIAARLWEHSVVASGPAGSVESRIARAIARRREFLTPEAFARTDAFRLIHGEADGLPGLFVDVLGPLLRVMVRGRSVHGFLERARKALSEQLPYAPNGALLSVLELSLLRGAGRRVDTEAFERVRWRAGGTARIAESVPIVNGVGYTVRENGLEYFIDPGWDSPRRVRPGYGLFVDQRENRERVSKAASVGGGSWLNLFAHTGAFSVALLAAGAEAVCSVDLSAPYLARLELNLEANREQGIDPARHQSVRGDVRRFLEERAGGEHYQGIVIDPPTAASAGRRFWSVKQDLEPLLGLSLGRLASGGTLLVTQNRSGHPLGLDKILERLARQSGRPVAHIQPARPGVDHPSLRGFPEGDPFEGWILKLG